MLESLKRRDSLVGWPRKASIQELDEQMILTIIQDLLQALSVWFSFSAPWVGDENRLVVLWVKKYGFSWRHVDDVSWGHILTLHEVAEQVLLILAREQRETRVQLC